MLNYVITVSRQHQEQHMFCVWIEYRVHTQYRHELMFLRASPSGTLVLMTTCMLELGGVRCIAAC
jgi:hypothetical protein